MSSSPCASRSCDRLTGEPRGSIRCCTELDLIVSASTGGASGCPTEPGVDQARCRARHPQLVGDHLHKGVRLEAELLVELVLLVQRLPRHLQQAEEALDHAGSLHCHREIHGLSTALGEV